MLRSVVLLPHPPLLLPQNRGRREVADELRHACVAVLREVGVRTAGLTVVAGAESGGPVAPLPSRAPLGVRVARHLIEQAGGPAAEDPGVAQLVVTADTPPEQCLDLGQDLAARLQRPAPDGTAQPQVVVVAADGSARRGPRAPGHLHPAAAAFDEQWEQAVRTADVPALAQLSPAVAEQVWCGGRAALQVCAGLARAAAAGGAPRAQVRYRDDPFGVLYVVARWDFR